MCKEPLRAYAECIHGKLFAVVWECRAENRALNDCLHPQCARASCTRPSAALAPARPSAPEPPLSLSRARGTRSTSKEKMEAVFAEAERKLNEERRKAR